MVAFSPSFSAIYLIMRRSKNYYRKVGKPYNAADARNVDFPEFGGRGAPIWWWALVVSDRASVSCYRPSIQSRKDGKVSFAVFPQF